MTVVATTTLEMLQRIYSEMQAAEAFVARQAEAHIRAFVAQVQDKIGAANVIIDEPYLEYEKARAVLDLLIRLEKTFDRLDTKTPGISDSTAEGLDIDEEASVDIAETIERQKLSAAISFKQALDKNRQQQFGLKKYIWRSQGDDRVRESHAANEGKLCDWQHPPPTGNPGDEVNCRCWAEPTTDAIDSDWIAPVLIGLAAVLAAQAAVAAAATILTRAGGRIVARQAARRAAEAAKPKPAPKPVEKPSVTERPKGVPKDWKSSPTKGGEGREYQHPTDKGTYVKVEKGNPNASQPGQRYDNVRVQKNGKSYDKHGNEVPRKSEESHIPLDEFNAEIFNL